MEIIMICSTEDSKALILAIRDEFVWVGVLLVNRDAIRQKA